MSFFGLWSYQYYQRNIDVDENTAWPFVYLLILYPSGQLLGISASFFIKQIFNKIWSIFIEIGWIPYRTFLQVENLYNLIPFAYLLNTLASNFVHKENHSAKNKKIFYCSSGGGWRAFFLTQCSHLWWTIPIVYTISWFSKWIWLKLATLPATANLWWAIKLDNKKDLTLPFPLAKTIKIKLLRNYHGPPLRWCKIIQK